MKHKLSRAKRLKIPRRPTVFAASIMILAAAVAGAVWWAAAVDWADGNASLKDVDDSLGLGASPAVPAVREQEWKVAFSSSATPTTAVVHVHLRRMSVTDQTVHAHVSVDIDESMISEVFDRSTNKPLTFDDLVADPYGPMWLTVQMDQVFAPIESPNPAPEAGGQAQPCPGASQTGFPFATLQISLGSLGELPAGAGTHVHLFGDVCDTDVRTLGSVRSFPSDAYAVQAYAFLVLPPQLEFRGPGATQPNRSLPSRLIFSSDDNLGDFDISYRSSSNGNGAVVHIDRAFPIRLVTFGICLLPLILAMLVGAIATERPLGDLLPTLGILLGAVFTVLPLRAVLVPAEIATVTRVDLILGAEVMLLLVVGAAMYLRHTVAHSRTANVSDTSRRGH